MRVTWARGKIQCPHFRHAGRTPAERRRAAACDLFCLSLGTPTSESSGGRAGAGGIHPKLRLYVRWYEQTDRVLQWSLSVAVPDPGEANFDDFVIEEDAQAPSARYIPRSVLNGEQRFPVRARPGTYQVRGFDRDRQVTWAPPSTGRLEANGPTVFAIGATGGFQLDLGEALVRGRNYLLLAPSSWLLTPPDSIVVEPIRSSLLSDPRCNWQGHLLFVPQRAEEEIEDWCVDVLSRPLEDSTASLEVVFLPVTEAADGRLHIGPDEPTVLFLGEGWTNPVFEILDRSTRENPDWPLGEQIAFCSVNPLPVGIYSIFIREELVGDVERLEFAVDTLATPTVAGVVLITKQAGEDLSQRADLLDEAAGHRWAALLAGREVLRDIQLPDGWKATLRWQGRDGTNHGPDTLDQTRALSAVSACLERRPRSASLSAGLFGAVAWCESAEQPLTRTVALSPALEARLRWVMLKRRTGPADGVALGLAVPRTAAIRLTASYRRLVEDFLAVVAWPVALLPRRDPSLATSPPNWRERPDMHQPQSSHIVLGFCPPHYWTDDRYSLVPVSAMVFDGQWQRLPNAASIFLPEGTIYVARSWFPDAFQPGYPGAWGVIDQPDWQQKQLRTRYCAARLVACPPEFVHVPCRSDAHESVRQVLLHEGVEYPAALGEREVLLEFSDDVVAGPMVLTARADAPRRFGCSEQALRHPLPARRAADLQRLTITVGEVRRSFSSKESLPAASTYLDFATLEAMLEMAQLSGGMGQRSTAADMDVDKMAGALRHIISSYPTGPTWQARRARLEQLLSQALEADRSRSEWEAYLRGHRAFEDAARQAAATLRESCARKPPLNCRPWSMSWWAGSSGYRPSNRKRKNCSAWPSRNGHRYRRSVTFWPMRSYNSRRSANGCTAQTQRAPPSVQRRSCPLPRTTNRGHYAGRSSRTPNPDR